MTLNFYWYGAHGYVTLFPNPEIRLHSVPAGTTSISFTLTQGVRELGGQDVLVPGNGTLPFGGDPDIWSVQSRRMSMDFSDEIIDGTDSVGGTLGSVRSGSIAR